MRFGFIFTRCVKTIKDNTIWVNCYNSIRKFYSEQIIIINDNCNKDVIIDIELINTQVIDSEFNGSAEILPYYYFYKLKPFDKAVILHDSMMVNNIFDYNNYKLTDVIFLWHFSKDKNHFIKEEKELLLLCNSNDIIELYDTKDWVGSLGATSFITYDFVKLLQDTFNFLKYVNYLNIKREYRHSFERAFAVLCWNLSDTIKIKPSLFGDLYSENMAIISDIDNLHNFKSVSPLIKVQCRR